MSASAPRKSVQRVVLVPAAPISSRARTDELVRRYRLARLRTMSPETTAAAFPSRVRGG